MILKMHAGTFIQEQSRPKMTDKEFQQFRDVIYEQTHIHCADTQRPLFERKVRSRLTALQLSSFQTYYQFLTDRHDGAQEFLRLIDVIAVHETSFFRIRGHFTTLTDLVFPDLFQQVEGSPIRLWSAGCSTGQEPYSIGISFMEYVSQQRQSPVKSRQLEILATDISSFAIQKAQNGVYSPKKVQKIPQAFLDKYFMNYNDQYHVIDGVKNFVNFTVSNLIDVNTFPERNFHIIFCRNVLIYFDRQAQATLLHAMVQSLSEGGYLFLGDAESIHIFPGITRQLQPVYSGNAIIYQKHGG